MDQENFSDGNVAFSKENKNTNKLKISNLSKKVFLAKTTPSNLKINQINDNKKENSFEYSNNKINGNFNVEQNFLSCSNDLNIETHNFNKNFQKEFSRSQGNPYGQGQDGFQNPNNFMNQNFRTSPFNNFYNNSFNFPPNKNLNCNLNSANQISINQNINTNQEFNQAYNQNFSKHRFNENFISNNIQMQNNNNFQNSNARNHPLITKNFQMENYPNSPMPNDNSSTRCRYPNYFNRNLLANTSDSDYSYNNHINPTSKEHTNKTSKTTLNPYLNNNYNKNCNSIFNNNHYNFNHFYVTQNPHYNNINSNPNNNYFNLDFQNNSNMRTLQKNQILNLNNNNKFNFYNQKQFNNSYNIEHSINDSFNLNRINPEKHSESSIINETNNKIDGNDKKDNANEINEIIGKANNNKKNKYKNKVKSFKGFTNPENNLCKSFQSTEKHFDNKTISSNITSKLNKLKQSSNLNSNSNKNFNEKELLICNKNQTIEKGSSCGSNLSSFSGYYNELVDTSSCNLEDSMKSLEINSQFPKAKLHGYSSEATDSNSKENSFYCEKRMENDICSGINKNVRLSSGNVNNKKSLFNKEKKEPLKELKEDLISFLENIDFELDEYICSQKGSRYF